MGMDKNPGPKGTTDLRTRDELITEYKENGEQRFLRTCFREDYAPNLKTTDLIDHLQHMADEHHFTGDKRYKRLLKYLRRLSGTIGCFYNGKKGEWLAGRALRRFFVRNEVIDCVCVSFGDDQAEIDYIVITSKGVFLIEVKYYTCDVSIDECAIIRNAYGYQYEPYSIGEKMRTKEYVLLGILRAELGEDICHTNIHSILLFANDSTGWVDSFGKCKICRCGNVVQEIEGYEGDDVFTEEQIEQIKATILKNCFEARYPQEIDLDLIASDLDYVMELIEAEGSEGEDVAPEEPERTERDCAGETARHTDHSALWLALPAAAVFACVIFRSPTLARTITRFCGL